MSIPTKPATQAVLTGVNFFYTSTKNGTKFINQLPISNVGKISPKALENLRMVAQIRESITKIKDEGTQLAKEFTTVKKQANGFQKFMDAFKNGNLKSPEMGKTGGWLAYANLLLAAVGVILGIRNAKDINQLSNNLDELQDINARMVQVQSDELSGQLRLLKKFNSEIKTINKKVEDNNKNLTSFAQDLRSAMNNGVKAREMANDSLYETRVNNQRNKDAIAALNTRFLDLQSKFTNQVNGIASGFQKTVSEQLAKLQQQVTNVTTIANNAIAKDNETVSKANSAIAKANEALNKANQIPKNLEQPSKQEIKEITSKVEKINKTVADIPTLFNITQATIKQVVDRGLTPLSKIAEPWGITVTPATVTPATVTVSDGGAVTVTPATVTAATVTPAQFSSSAIGREIDKKISNVPDQKAKIEELADKDSVLAGSINNLGMNINAINDRINKMNQSSVFQLQNSQIDGLKTRVNNLEKQINDNKQDLEKINNDLKIQDIMNKDGLNVLNGLKPLVLLLPAIDAKINGLTPTINNIPNATANQVVPEIRPNVEQAICGSKCLPNFLGNQTNDINNAAAAANNNLLDKINVGLNAANLAADGAAMGMLGTINNKLGDQIPGGLGGMLTKFRKWSGIDRIINLLSITTSIHNAIMLSNNVVDTLFTILDNIIAIPRLVADSEAEPVDSREVFNGAFDSFMKGIFGVQQWEDFKTRWAAANRIYQSSSNVIDNVRQMGSNISDSVQIVGSWTAELGNGLVEEGILGEDNWKYKPEDPKIKGGIFGKIDKFNNTVGELDDKLNSILQVTQNIRDIVETANQIKQETSEIRTALSQAIATSEEDRQKILDQLPDVNFDWTDLQ